MSFNSQFLGNGQPKMDILQRLSTIKPNHGNYRKAQDAMIEITELRKSEALKNERILNLEARVRELEARHDFVARQVA